MAEKSLLPTYQDRKPAVVKPLIPIMPIGKWTRSTVYTLLFCAAFTVWAFTSIFIERSTHVLTDMGCTLNAHTIEALLWAFYAVVYACFGVVGPYCLVYLYNEHPHWFIMLPQTWNDEWDGGFWHREDEKDIDVEKGFGKEISNSNRSNEKISIKKPQDNNKIDQEPTYYPALDELLFRSWMMLTPPAAEDIAAAKAIDEAEKHRRAMKKTLGEQTNESGRSSTTFKVQAVSGSDSSHKYKLGPSSQGSHQSTPPDSSIPDILVLKIGNTVARINFPAYAISDGKVTIGNLRRLAAQIMNTDDCNRIKLYYKGKELLDRSHACRNEGLKHTSKVVCVLSQAVDGQLE